MNYKRVTGLVILIIGVILIIFAVHSMHRIANAKENVNAVSTPFSGNPVGNAVGGMMKNEASQYDKEVMWLLIGGILFAVVGAGMAVCCRSKRKR